MTESRENNGQYLLQEEDNSIVNGAGKLVNASRAVNCCWLADHIYISHLQKNNDNRYDIRVVMRVNYQLTF